MNENGPEPYIDNIEPIKPKHLAVALAFLLVSVPILGKVLKVVDPIEPRYRMSLKSQSSKEGIPQLPVVEFQKICIDTVVHAAPAGYVKTYYKDCE